MKLITAALTSILLLTTQMAHSRDTKHMLSIQEAMATADFHQRLDPTIQMKFGDQRHGPVLQHLMSVTTNKKTNAFNKSDENACRWVFLSALIALQERAKREGGNAVINIHSFYKKNEVTSNTQFECHAGALLAGVALKGDIVRLK